jgi:hypothetical protein
VLLVIPNGERTPGVNARSPVEEIGPCRRRVVTMKTLKGR